MGAVSVSMGSPSRRRASRMRPASRTISGPMPSPGRMAIFIGGWRPATGLWRLPWAALAPAAGRATGDRAGPSRDLRQPRLLGQSLRLEGANGVGVLQRESDLVEAVEQALLAGRLHREV